MLILTGAEDHFIPLKMHHLQMAALTQARSLTARIFTRADHAENHCQVGNIGLALEVMRHWIAEKGPVPERAPQPVVAHGSRSPVQALGAVQVA